MDWHDQTQALFQALLDHFWTARRLRAPREAKLFPAGYLISYSSLVQKAGVAVEARRLGGPLAEISQLCEVKGWPPMAALVVRQDGGQPGVGYFRKPGGPAVDLVTESHVAAWAKDAKCCIEFASMPRRAPHLTEPAPRPRRRTSTS